MICLNTQQTNWARACVCVAVKEIAHLLQSFKWIFESFKNVQIITHAQHKQFYAHFGIPTLQSNDVYDDDLVAWHISIFYFIFHLKKCSILFICLLKMELFVCFFPLLCHNALRISLAI